MTVRDDDLNKVPAPVPPEVPQPRTALQVAFAAIARLTDLKRPPSRIVHRRVHPRGEESRKRLFSNG